MRVVGGEIDGPIVHPELPERGHRLTVVRLVECGAALDAEFRRPLLARLPAAPRAQILILPLPPGADSELLAHLWVAGEVGPDTFGLRFSMRHVAPVRALRLVKAGTARLPIGLIAGVERPPALAHGGLVRVIRPLRLRLGRQDL